MEAKDVILVDLIGKKDNIFYVPLYQRKYTWEVEKHVKQLWDDLLFFKENLDKKRDFFIGSIIIKKNNSLNAKHILVDGQQRITTMLLLIAALINCSKKINDAPHFFVLKAYLQSDDDKFKLERIQDSEIIKKILNDQSSILLSEEKKTNYYRVFKYFCEQINKKNDENDIFIKDFTNNVLQKIKVASINLNDDEDENMIFESINSKGKSLTVADLIKNYIVMNIDQDNTEILKKFDNKFIQYFDKFKKPDEQLVSFYRHMFSIDTGNLLNKKGSQIYFKFKDKFSHITDKSALSEKLIQYMNDICDELVIYDYIQTLPLQNWHYPLMKTNKDNFYGLLHVIIKCNSQIDRDSINITNLKNIDWAFRWISQLVVARCLVSFGRVDANRTYAKLAYDLNEEYKKTNDFKASFTTKVINFLTHSTSNYRMPSRSEIFDIETKRDLYTELKNTLKEILIAIEELLSKSKLPENMLHKMTVEHIFPQESSKWEELSNNSGLTKINTFEEMKGWLNTLGNLSIIDRAINSALSNEVFAEKQRILDERSYLKINKMIYDYKEWSVEEIKKRARNILDYIDEIWFKPISD